MKKIVSVFLAALMFTMVLCVNAVAAADYSVKFSKAYGGGYTYVTLNVGDGDVYYTTNGTAPTESSKEYTGGKLKFTKPTTLRVAVYDNGKLQKRYKTSVIVRLAKPTVTMTAQYTDGYVYSASAKNGAAVYYTTDGTTPTSKNGIKANGKIYAPEGTKLTVRAIKSGWKGSLVRTVSVPMLENKLSDAERFAAEVVTLVNKERAAYGLQPLSTKPELDKAATKRSEEIVVSFAHTRPDGSSCFTVLEEYDVSYWSCGENIAAGQRTPEAVVEAWMNSSGHRANILNPGFSYIGVGYTAGGSYGVYWSQVFTG